MKCVHLHADDVGFGVEYVEGMGNTLIGATRVRDFTDQVVTIRGINNTDEYQVCENEDQVAGVIITRMGTIRVLSIVNVLHNEGSIVEHYIQDDRCYPGENRTKHWGQPENCLNI